MTEYTEEELRELEELEKEETLNEEINQETKVEDEEVEETLNDEIETEVENEKVEETEVENEEVEETEVENEEVEEETDEVEISEHTDTVYDKFKKRAVAYMMIYGILPKNYKYTEWNSDLQQKYLQLQYAVGCKVYKEAPDSNHDIFNYDKAIISKK